MGLYPPIAENQIANIIGGERMVSRVFFADGAHGDDGNVGNRREKPFATIQAAIDACGDYYQDTIYVMSTAQLEADITVNKHNVSIIGLPPPHPQSQPGTWIAPVGGTRATIRISAGAVNLKNLYITGVAGQPCVDFTAGATHTRVGITSCYFDVGTYGVSAHVGVNAPSHHLIVKDCTFQGGLTVGGIYYAANGSWNIFDGNFFDLVPGPQIHVVSAGGTAASRIINNRFSLDSDTNGEAISFLGSNTRWFIDNNVAADSGITDPGNTPYGDNQNPSAQMWGRNYRGGTIIAPVAL